MRKYLLTVLLACMFLNALPSNAEGDLFYQDPELRTYLSQSILDLEKQAKQIQEQYISVTSRLSKLEYDIPEKFQSLSNLFQLSNSEFSIDNDAHLFYDSYELSDLEKFYLFSEGDRYGNPDPPSPFATLAQLLAVSNQVVTLSGSFSSLSSNLTSLQNTINSISALQTSLQTALQNLTAAYNLLNEQCSTLTSVVKVNNDGSVVIAKSSPIDGRIEPTSGASCWQPAIDGNWDRAGNTFRVSRDTQLENVTLYCDNAARILSPQNVYISSCEVNSGVPQIIEYASSSVNTSSFPRITYSFSSPVPISSDRDYLLCVKRTGNAPLYVYTCPNVRYGEFYKPYGASDEPRGGGNDSDSDDDYEPTPRSGLTPQQGFYEYLSACWSLTYTSQDIWSIFKFTDDESFTFSEEGMSVERGNITVGGSEVVTSSSLSNMFVSILDEYPNLLNSKITWNMFGQEVTNKIITTAGGSITGELYVTSLQIPNNGNWLVGLSNAPADLVLVNTNSSIRSFNGDLKLASPNGKIKAESFFKFSANQKGRVTIPPGASQFLIRANVSENAMVLVTPAQNPQMNYWVSYDNGCAFINLEDETEEPLTFFYLILED